MELALSLGDATNKPFSLVVGKSQKIKDLGFCMDMASSSDDGCKNVNVSGKDQTHGAGGQTRVSSSSSSDPPPPPPVQLDLLPFAPVHPSQPPPNKLQFPFPWLNQKLGGDSGRRGDDGSGGDQEGAPLSSPSPNSAAVSSFHHMDFSIFRSSAIRSAGKRDFEQINGEGSEGAAADRGSDEDESGTARKKLRLSKEQSAFLEESFKEHNTLNPKQKIALAKQLNLRPRQVEVWFQNRRARTKLKQTEVDCEYLKRWCETLTEENRRLQKELQELRALKAASHQPFYMQQVPATTLTMCPSCERVVTTTTPSSNALAPPKKHLLSLSPSQTQPQQLLQDAADSD